MIVTISSRHMEVGEALKTFTEQKANKLTRFYDRIQEIEVVFNSVQGQIEVEFIVNAEHKNMFIATQSGTDAYVAVDACVTKLERQLHEHKDKYRNRKHPGGEDKRDMRSVGNNAGSEA